MSIRRRLMLAYALLILVTGTVTALAALRIHSTTRALEVSGGVLLPLVAELGELRALVEGSRTYLNRAGPDEELGDQIRSFLDSFSARQEALQALADLAERSEEARGTVPRVHMDEALRLLKALAKAEDRDGFLALLNQVDRELRLVLVLSRAELKTRSKEASRAGDNEVRYLVLLAAVGGLGVAVLTITLITPLRSLEGLRRAVERIEEGKRVALPDGGNDEIGAVIRAVQRMAETVQGREQTLRDERTALRRAQSQIVNLIESVPQALIVLDADGRISRINEGCRQLFEAAPERFLGRAIGQSPAAVIEGASERINTLLHGGSEDWVDEQALGNDRRIAVHLSGLRDRDSSRLAPPITGAILVIEEVTRRFDAELALRRHERLAATGRIAAQVVHEVRNPLSTIGLAARMLGDDLPKGSDPEGWLDQIRSEAARLERVTQAYLQLARLPDPKPASTPLGPLIADLIRFLNDPRLSGELTDDLVAWVDQDGLRGVLINLIQNALQAVDPVEGRVVLSGQLDGNQVRVIIEDNGPGIPEGVLNRLGEAFIDGRPSGTGLGLALAVEVLSDQGGRLEVNRRAEGGTRCEAILPRPEAAT